MMFMTVKLRAGMNDVKIIYGFSKLVIDVTGQEQKRDRKQLKTAAPKTSLNGASLV